MNIVRIKRPELTAKEKEKRLREIKEAAIDLLVATEKAKIRKEKHS